MPAIREISISSLNIWLNLIRIYLPINLSRILGMDIIKVENENLFFIFLSHSSIFLFQIPMLVPFFSDFYLHDFKDYIL